MLDHLKTTVGVAAVTFALTASISAGMTNESPDDPPTPTPSPAVVETAPAPQEDVVGDVVEGDSENPAIAGVEGEGEGAGCVEALTERARSRERLQSHVDDGTLPAGGAAGNQNALDHQCGGAFANTTAEGGGEPSPGAIAPEDGGEAPGHSGESHGSGQNKPKP